MIFGKGINEEPLNIRLNVKNRSKMIVKEIFSLHNSHTYTYIQIKWKKCDRNKKNDGI